jgi:succinate dehydrogenase (ubiquinone) cytochrome b560 subunit
MDSRLRTRDDASKCPQKRKDRLTFTMASLITLAPTFRSSVQRSIRMTATRSMTIISKDSGEDFKKQVRVWRSTIFLRTVTPRFTLRLQYSFFAFHH